eukprot:1871741-Rhodomonas_salina.3
MDTLPPRASSAFHHTSYSRPQIHSSPAVGAITPDGPYRMLSARPHPPYAGSTQDDGGMLRDVELELLTAHSSARSLGACARGCPEYS